MFRIVIIIVNWNGGEKIIRCVDSIHQRINMERFLIIVVDNHSRDGSPERIKEKYPHVVLIRNQKNLGFSRANNIALKYVRDHGIQTDYIFFINNDTSWVDPSMRDVLDFLDTYPDIAGLTPCIRGSDGQYQTGVGGKRFTLINMALYYFFLNRLPFLKSSGIYINQAPFVKRGKIIDLDWISGAALLVRVAVLKDHSLFPEEFFMYAEDLVVSERLRKSGRLIFYPFFKIEHHREFRLESIRLYYRSLFIFLKQKHFSRFKTRMCRNIIFSGLIVRYLFFKVTAIIDRRNIRRTGLITLQLRALKQEKPDSI